MAGKKLSLTACTLGLDMWSVSFKGFGLAVQARIGVKAGGY